MGRGKGTFSKWFFFANAGHILFEVVKVPDRRAYRALSLGKARLPMKSKIYKVLY